MQVADNIWVPDSYADKALVSLNRAVREYDERLMFGLNETNGDWCVFLKMPHGQPPVVVLGFQYTLPEPAAVLAKLRECDTRVHSDGILERMNAHNDALRKPSRDRADEAIEQAAEGWESYLHRRGDTPYHRSLPKKDPKQRSA